LIAIDTNILVYAHRADSNFHKKADALLTELAESGKVWSIPWPCLHEFLAIVTHPRIYNPPTPLKDALLQVDYWLECPTLHPIGETADYWKILKSQLETAQSVGPKIHDARIASVCLQHNVRMLWSADRDFSRIKGMEIINPLI
jgi:toxin-antitoxin system PIN domain toxin